VELRDGDSLPVPHFNVLNGGVHAPNELDFQEFMIAPVGAPSIADAVRAGAEIYAALRRELADRKLSTGLGDEGGFAPELSEPEDVLRLLVRAIGTAGYAPGRDGVSIALDLAPSEFPVHLIEDGLGEDDDAGWIALTDRLGETVELVGEGTVTETLAAMAVCRKAGYRQFVSHRSGETEDTFIADLAVGTGCGHLKSGAPARGERTAKYNRLVEISATAPVLRYGMT
jgi:enolase